MRRCCLLLLVWNLTAVALAQPLPSRPLLVLDTGGHSATVRKVLFTPDSKRLVTVSYDKTVRVWDTATGETLKVCRLAIGPGDEGQLNAAAVSPSGRTLAVAGVPVGRGKFGVPIYLVGLETGKVEQVIRGHTDFVECLAFSPDGKWLASGGFDRTVRIHSLPGGQLYRQLTGHAERILNVVFSPDNKLVATAAADHTGRVWSLARAQTVAELKGHTENVYALAWSPDGKTLATGSSDGTIRTWTPAGKPMQTAPLRDRDIVIQIISLTFTPDSKELLYTGIGYRGKAGLLDVASGKPRLEFAEHGNTVMHGALSRGGTLAATTGGDNHETFIWKTADGSVVHKLVGAGQSVWGVGWGPDSKTIAWGNTNRRGTELGNPPLERTFHLEELEFGGPPGGNFQRGRLSRGKYSLSLDQDFQMQIKDDQTVRLFRTDQPKERVYCFDIFADSRAIVGTAFGLYQVDLATGKIVRTYAGHSGIVLCVASSPDGRYFLTGSTDQTLCIWDVQQDQPLLSLFIAGPEWIAYTPQGYYACSAAGEQLMGWQINNGLDAAASYYPAARFRKSLYHPAALRLLLQAGSLDKALAQAAGKKPATAVTVAQVLPPTVTVTLPQTGVRVAQPRVEVRATARSVGKNPVTAMRLLLDGRPYKGQAGIKAFPVPRLGDVAASWTVELTPGAHVLAVQAESAVSKGLSPPVELTYARPTADPDKLPPPNLFVLAVGVSAYPEPMRLQYAASDAEAIQKVLKEKTGKAFTRVEVQLLSDSKARKADILKGMDWLASVMTPRDVGVVFFSGHGARYPDGNFYLVPVDVDPNKGHATLVPGDLIKEKLGEMPGRLIAVLDCCHSGSVAEEGGRAAQALTDDLVRDLLTEDYGVITMCSSLGREYSLESPAVRAGFFTLALVEGLAGRADANKDGQVHFNELDAYAFKRVRDLSRGMQNPVTGKPATIRSFPLASSARSA
jgi:WD40 repeat protein